MPPPSGQAEVSLQDSHPKHSPVVKGETAPGCYPLVGAEGTAPAAGPPHYGEERVNRLMGSLGQKPLLLTPIPGTCTASGRNLFNQKHSRAPGLCS